MKMIKDTECQHKIPAITCSLSKICTCNGVKKSHRLKPGWHIFLQSCIQKEADSRSKCTSVASDFTQLRLNIILCLSPQATELISFEIKSVLIRLQSCICSLLFRTSSDIFTLLSQVWKSDTLIQNVLMHFPFR